MVPTPVGRCMRKCSLQVRRRPSSMCCPIYDSILCMASLRCLYWTDTTFLIWPSKSAWPIEGLVDLLARSQGLGIRWCRSHRVWKVLPHSKPDKVGGHTYFTSMDHITHNVDLNNSYFAEIEQAGFSPSHMVPGWTHTEDPVLQARLFAYSGSSVYCNVYNPESQTQFFRHTTLSLGCQWSCKLH